MEPLKEPLKEEPNPLTSLKVGYWRSELRMRQALGLGLGGFRGCSLTVEILKGSWDLVRL